ncbi:serine hydrolase [Streptomyces sp. NPDC012510]|uniref:serine hydrolase n=1 Tax=Streptomyces sp. NPDC012510 TaxID=3364838 RepID=UPI0036EE44DD
MAVGSLTVFSADSRGAERLRRPLLPLAPAVLVLVGGSGFGAVYMKARAQSGAGVAVSSVASSSVSPPASASTVPGADVVAEEASVEPAAIEVDHDGLLAAALADEPVEDGAAVSVAVLEVASGESAVYGDDRYDTASIVKLNILAALLLQAQDGGRQLTVQERSYASAMIRDSDNASATALWKAIGRADGLGAANERFGLRNTEGGDGLYWGLTLTTASDQLALLRQVFGDDGTSELSEASRTYVQGLMGRIAEGQDWGVSAAASDSSAAASALKNGWLPRTATGLWDINSVGRVVVDGREYLVAVVSNGNTTKASGISLVEAAAKAAVAVFGDTETAVIPSGVAHTSGAGTGGAGTGGAGTGGAGTGGAGTGS